MKVFIFLTALFASQSLFAAEISVEALNARLKKGEAFNILDARELGEFEVSHIQGAKFVGYKKFNLQKTLETLDSTKLTVVYCSVGYRSGKVVKKLIKSGVQAYNLKGGIFEWFNQGHNVYKNSSVTHEIHGYNRAWSQKIKSKRRKLILPKKSEKSFWDQFLGR